MSALKLFLRQPLQLYLPILRNIAVKNDDRVPQSVDSHGHYCISILRIHDYTQHSDRNSEDIQESKI